MSEYTNGSVSNTGVKEITKMVNVTETVTICDVCGKEVPSHLITTSTCKACGRVICCEQMKDTGLSRRYGGILWVCKDCYPRVKEIAGKVSQLERERDKITAEICALYGEVDDMNSANIQTGV